jgi:hypothetical protein
VQTLLSFYDALILVGHSSHQPYADHLNQGLKQYGYTAWQLYRLATRYIAPQP